MKRVKWSPMINNTLAHLEMRSDGQNSDRPFNLPSPPPLLPRYESGTSQPADWLLTTSSGNTSQGCSWWCFEMSFIWTVWSWLWWFVILGVSRNHIFFPAPVESGGQRCVPVRYYRPDLFSVCDIRRFWIRCQKNLPSVDRRQNKTSSVLRTAVYEH